MSTARNLSRLVQGLGALGLLTLVAVLTTTIDAAVFHSLPAPGGVIATLVAAALVATVLRGVGLAASRARTVRAGRAVLGRGQPADVDGREVIVIRDERLFACCAGWLKPRIVVTSAAVARLPPDQLRAVLAHEAAHAERRDPLRLLLAAIAAETLSFLPGARRLERRYRELLEVAADCTAAREVGRGPLAGALVSFTDQERNGARGPSAARVDGLLGARQRLGARGLASDGVVLGLLAAGALAATARTGCLAWSSGATTCAAEQPSMAALVAVLSLSAAFLVLGSCGQRARRATICY